MAMRIDGAPRGEYLAIAARSAEHALQKMRGAGSGLLDQVQLMLRKIEAANDPEAAAWVARMRAQVADGTIQKRVAQQQPLEEIVDEWKRARGAHA